MEPQFWHNKWKTGDIGFHEDEINPHLLRHISQIDARVVFVPLCGKTRDMDWLLTRGSKIIGVELSLIACEDFFKESKRPFTRVEHQGFTIFRGEDIEIWCGDIFDLPSEAVVNVTGMYDRAAMIALPTDLRKKYVQKIRALADEAPNFKSVLLVTLDYPQEKVLGPPFSVSQKEVEHLYSADFKIKVVNENLDIDFSDNPKFQGVRVAERVYLLKNSCTPPRPSRHLER